MKFLFIVLLVAALVFAFYYLPTLFKSKDTQCAAGTKYARSIQGGGWAETQPSDPWGTCVDANLVQTGQ